MDIKDMTDIISNKDSQNITTTSESFTPALQTTNFKTNVPVPTVPLKYCPDTVDICEKVVRQLGTELAAKQHLKVRSSTWANWKKRHPEFVSALLRAHEDHIKYTLRDIADVKLKAVKTWEQYLEPQKRETITELKTRVKDADGNPITVSRPVRDKNGKKVLKDGEPQMEEVGVYNVKTTKKTYWVEPNFKVLQSFIGTDNMDTFVLENLGKDYIDSAEDIIVQLLGKFVDLEEIKSVPELVKYLLAPEIDILMLRKLQVINESKMAAGHISQEQYNNTAIATTKAVIDANIKIETKRKAPFGNKSYSEVANDYRNVTLNVVNVFREVLNADPSDIDTEAVVKKVYEELRDRNAAGEILGAILRGDPEGSE